MTYIQQGETWATTRSKINQVIKVSYTDLLADTELTYTGGASGTVTAGDLYPTTEGNWFEVAASDAVDQHITTAGGVKLYEAGPHFSTRARAAAAWARMVARSETPPAGTVWSWPGSSIVYDGTSTDIPGFTGWTPFFPWAKMSLFGCVGDAVVSGGSLSSGTDDSTAMQAAFDWQQGASGRELWGDAGATYLITSTITNSEADLSVKWNGAKVFKNSTGNAFTLTCPVSFYDLSADYTEGATSFTVDTTGTALAEGQIIVVVSDAVARANRDEGSNSTQYRTAEFAIVASGTTATTIELEQPLREVIGISPTSTAGDEARVASYTTALNARIAVPTILKLDWQGGEVEFAEGHGQGSGSIWQGAALQVYGHTGQINDFRVTRAYDPAIQATGCMNLEVNRPFGSHLENNTGDGQYGYGFSDASYHSVVRGAFWDDTRHGYTTAGGALTADQKNDAVLGAPGAIGGKVVECIGVRHTLTAPFDTHHSGRDITFVDCYAEGCSSDWAFALRGRGHRVINPKTRNCEGGIFVFTEFDSGDTDDDLWTAGKEARDRSQAVIEGGDIEVHGIPFDVQYAEMALTGHMRVRSASNRLISGEGVVDFYGSIDFKCDDFEGAFTKDANNSTGIFNVLEASNANKGNLLPTSTFTVHSGASIDADTTDTSSTTTNLVHVEANSVFVNRGRISAVMPSDAVLFTSTGTISTEDSGIFRFELDGAADNANTLNLIGRQANVEAVDGSVRWLAPLRSGGLQTLYVDVTDTVITGTGSELSNQYDYNVENVRKHLGAIGSGAFQIRQRAFHAGTTGAATWKFDSFGNFQDSFDIATGDEYVEVDVIITVQSDTTYNTIVRSCSSDQAASAVGVVRGSVRNDTVTSLQTEAGTIIDLDPTIANTDTLTIRWTEVQVTEGGFF